MSTGSEASAPGAAGDEPDHQQATQWLADALAVHAGVDRAVAHTTVTSISRLKSVLDAKLLVCAAVLRAVSSTPEQDMAAAARSNPRDGDETIRRLRVTEQAPPMAEALESGDVSVGHVDALGRSLRRLEPEQQQRMLEVADELVDVAKSVTPHEFDRHLRRTEKTLTAHDSAATLARQRGAVRLVSWIGRDDGMYHCKLVVDPLTGSALDRQIREATETRFHTGQVPDHAPTDPIERQQFLRAHAVLQILGVTGQPVGAPVGGRAGRPLFIAVVDTRVSHGPPHVDWGIPVDVPDSEVRNLAATSRQITVELDGHRVVSAPGEMRLGRSTRLAGAGQRHVLRALYATCAVPGCDARFDDCTIHHVTWWRHGGATDLDNLVPLCTMHHHRVHDSGWELRLHHDRSLTVQLPDGRSLHGVPTRTVPTSTLPGGVVGAGPPVADGHAEPSDGGP